MGFITAAVCVLMATQAAEQPTNPFAGKALLFLPGGHVETDVRVSQIGSVTYLVFAPSEVRDGQRVIPRCQRWRQISTLPTLRVYADPEAARATAKRERDRVKQLNPNSTESVITRYAQPAGRPSVVGKPVIVSTEAQRYFSPRAVVRTVGNQAFFVLTLEGNREHWVNASVVKWIEVYDDVEAAESMAGDTVWRTK